LIGLEARMGMASDVLAALHGWPAAAVRSLGSGLTLDGGPLAGVGWALLTAVDNLDAGEPPDRLARLKMAYELRCAAAAPDSDELLERLEAVDEAPWPQVRDAIAELRPAPVVELTVDAEELGP
jgi:hypothetical protein